MVADQLRTFLEDGNIRNSVNFPEVQIPRNEGHRLAIVNANVPNMLGQISTTLADAGLNIVDMLNKSRGELAYTLADVDALPSPHLVGDLAAIDGVMSVRTL
jgi:D-3-phosphoglycerate dehydrogenase